MFSLNSVLALVARWTVGKKILSGLGWVHGKIDGIRSEILIGLFCLTWALQLAGVLTEEQANAIYAVISPLLPVTILDRINKYMALAGKVVKR